MDELVEVECYSGYAYPERPRAIIWRNERYVVRSLLRTWRAPEGPHFELTLEDGSRQELTYDEEEDKWWLKMGGFYSQHRK